MLDHPGEAITSRRLSDKIPYSYEALYATLTALVQQGMVAWRRGEGTNAPTKYWLTDAGREWAEKGIKE
jgi:DNA-binding PadR family transcriptional regulator